MIVNLKTMPKDVAAELLHYLAENENFHSVEKMAGGDLTATEVKAMLREVASNLANEAALENKATFDVKGSTNLSKISKNLISCLTPREERELLSVFGVIEKKQS